MRKVATEQRLCMGCRLCEIWCAVQHSQSKDIIKAFKFERVKPMPRLVVEESGYVSFALQCRHCEEPLCVYGCIAGAMTKDPITGEVRHDSERCVGCWTCILACPYGAIARDERGHGIASKCDLCAGRDMPMCVEKCPNEALVLVEV